MPDEFHIWQPQLLTRTLQLTNYPPSRLFVGTDLNLYYDVKNPLWHKRPDWFLVLDVPRLYEGTDLRSSYTRRGHKLLFLICRGSAFRYIYLAITNKLLPECGAPTL
ncbi:MAG: hypothetical protein U7127_27005 [Phormidium sp.]